MRRYICVHNQYMYSYVYILASAHLFVRVKTFAHLCPITYSNFNTHQTCLVDTNNLLDLVMSIAHWYHDCLWHFDPGYWSCLCSHQHDHLYIIMCPITVQNVSTWAILKGVAWYLKVLEGTWLGDYWFHHGYWNWLCSHQHTQLYISCVLSLFKMLAPKLEWGKLLGTWYLKVLDGTWPYLAIINFTMAVLLAL